MNGDEGPVSFSPDGLTEQMIDALLREVYGAAAVAKPRPTSALMDGQAAQRRYRREARRCVAVVCVLPVRGVAGDPGGWAA